MMMIDTNIRWNIHFCSVVPKRTDRSRTCKARQNDACFEWITISAEACLTLLELRTGAVPVFFSSLIMRKRVGFTLFAKLANFAYRALLQSIPRIHRPPDPPDPLDPISVRYSCYCVNEHMLYAL